MPTNFGEYLKQKWVKRHFTCLNLPQKNGVSECKNSHLAKVTVRLIHGNKMHGRFWAEAMYTIAYIINRVPSQSLKHMLSYEKINRLS